MSTKVALPACACGPPWVRRTASAGCRVSMVLPLLFAAVRLSSLPTASRPAHTRLCKQPTCIARVRRCADAQTVLITSSGASRPGVFSTDSRFCRVKFRCPSQPRFCLCSGFAPVFWARSLASVTCGGLLYTWSHRDWETSDPTTAGREVVTRGSLGCVTNGLTFTVL